MEIRLSELRFVSIKLASISQIIDIDSIQTEIEMFCGHHK